MDTKKAYYKWAKECVDKLIGFQDLDKDSPSYGSFHYPSWKLGGDPTDKRWREADRWQEAVLTLAWFFKNDNNGFKFNLRLKKSIEAGINFWTEMPFSSYASAAFSPIAITEALKLMEDHLDEELKETALEHLIKAADFLANNEANTRLNQESAAALALYNISCLTGNKRKECTCLAP